MSASLKTVSNPSPDGVIKPVPGGFLLTVGRYVYAEPPVPQGKPDPFIDWFSGAAKTATIVDSQKNDERYAYGFRVLKPTFWPVKAGLGRPTWIEDNPAVPDEAMIDWFFGSPTKPSSWTDHLPGAIEPVGEALSDIKWIVLGGLAIVVAIQFGGKK